MPGHSFVSIQEKGVIVCLSESGPSVKEISLERGESTVFSILALPSHCKTGNVIARNLDGYSYIHGWVRPTQFQSVVVNSILCRKVVLKAPGNEISPPSLIRGGGAGGGGGGSRLRAGPHGRTSLSSPIFILMDRGRCTCSGL